MKKLLGIITVLVIFNTAAAAKRPVLNEKVLQMFELVFSNATHVIWRSENDLNEVSFMVNDMLIRAVFDDRGRLMRTIRYYQEANLPAIVRYRLKKEFGKMTISNVSELSTNDNLTYYVSLKDEQYLVNAVVDRNGEVAESKKYRRADL